MKTNREIITLEIFKSYLKYIEDYRKESAFCNVGGQLLDGFINLLSEHVGDKCFWIEYFVFDCDFGKNPQNLHFFNKETIRLDSVEKLWKVIKE